MRREINNCERAKERDVYSLSGFLSATIGEVNRDLGQVLPFRNVTLLYMELKEIWEDVRVWVCVE